ncbi:hypothetical protein E2542_SST16752 [Spatholobus suberectus]|nr:hypothetical protein E2542_SST16752 [Spatholobus suberectus]
MESCKIAMVLTIYIMAILVFAHCFVAENVAAIPPAPMESAGVNLCAPAVFVAIAFVGNKLRWISGGSLKKGKDLGRTA